MNEFFPIIFLHILKCLYVFCHYILSIVYYIDWVLNFKLLLQIRSHFFITYNPFFTLMNLVCMPVPLLQVPEPPFVSRRSHEPSCRDSGRRKFSRSRLWNYIDFRLLQQIRMHGGEAEKRSSYKTPEGMFLKPIFEQDKFSFCLEKHHISIYIQNIPSDE